MKKINRMLYRTQDLVGKSCIVKVKANKFNDKKKRMKKIRRLQSKREMTLPLNDTRVDKIIECDTLLYSDESDK